MNNTKNLIPCSFLHRFTYWAEGSADLIGYYSCAVAVESRHIT